MIKISSQNVLYEDNHLLVLNKPAGLATMGLPEGEQTLLTLAKDYIKKKYNKPGNVYLGVVSRLDFQVSGLIILARTSKAAARLNEQFRTHHVRKIYNAIVEGYPTPETNTYTDWICEDPRHRKMWITQSPATQSDAKESILHYRRMERLGTYSLVEVELETGRKHQIRLQMSHHGYPVVGDYKYGSKEPFPSGIALHAKSLRFTHPVLDTELELEASFPDAWQRYLNHTTFSGANQ